MSKPVLAVDFDDVVCGFNEAYIAYHNQFYGSQISFADAVTYDMCQLYDVSYDVLVERVKHFCHYHHDTIEPTEGAEYHLPLLAQTHDLQVVTSRCATLQNVMEGWLHRHGLMSAFSKIHFTNSFGSLYAKRRGGKLDVCRAIGAVALLEDAPENAHEVAGGGVPVLLPDKPWNQKVSHMGIIRVHSWKNTTLQLERL